MLQQLQAIADGKATKATRKELEKNFNETERPAEKLIKRSKKARNKLAGSKVADQIDKVLNENYVGKNRIRSEIEWILIERKEANKEEAQALCSAIRAFNAELKRLCEMADRL